MTTSSTLKLSTIAFLLAATACATTTPLASSDVNPGSTGVVRTQKGANGNTQVMVRVEHLPDPHRVDPSLKTYVVWVRPEGGARAINVGQIAIDKDRRATLTTLTPYKDFDVLVTGESSGVADAPSDYVMLSANVGRR